MTAADPEAARNAQMERYRRYANYARECREKAGRARNVAEAMRLVGEADKWAARAYHEVA